MQAQKQQRGRQQGLLLGRGLIWASHKSFVDNAKNHCSNDLKGSISEVYANWWKTDVWDPSKWKLWIDFWVLKKPVARKTRQRQKKKEHTAEIRVKIYKHYYSVHHTAWIHSTVVRTPVIAGLRTTYELFALKFGQCNCTITIDYVRRVGAYEKKLKIFIKMVEAERKWASKIQIINTKTPLLILNKSRPRHGMLCNIHWSEMIP